VTLFSPPCAHSSIIILTNVAFERWGHIFGDDDVIAAAKAVQDVGRGEATEIVLREDEPLAKLGCCRGRR